MLLASSFVCGCVRPSDKDVGPAPGSATLEEISFEACQKRDLIAGKRLIQLGNDIKAGRFKYDGPVLDEFRKINTEVTNECFSGLEKRLRDSFDPNQQKLDPQKVGDATIEYGKGRIRAGGG